MLYFDHAATTPIHPDVAEKMDHISRQDFGNPSSIYSSGRSSKSIIENARILTANMIEARPSEIFFTGSGTESNNIVLWSLLYQEKKHVITSSIEHPAVLKVLDELKVFGLTYDVLSVDSTGLIDPTNLRSSIKKDTGLISIMYVNNEVGTVQKIEELVEIAHDHRIPFHSDCVQSIGKMSVSCKSLGVDYMSFSAHKFYGPKGIGFLYKKEGLPIKPLVIGGGQESNVRAGTENLSGIAGLGIASQLVTNDLDNRIDHLEKIQKHFKSKIYEKCPSVIFHGNEQSYAPGICSLALPGIKNEIMLTKLDRKGIEISNGSACSSGTVGLSPILEQMGIEDSINRSTIRVSFGTSNTINDVDYLVESISELSHE